MYSSCLDGVLRCWDIRTGAAKPQSHYLCIECATRLDAAALVLLTAILVHTQERVCVSSGGTRRASWIWQYPLTSPWW